ncbi:hypothetical protein ACIRLA_22305 [Streptomyces sp. NPDC102364]|uniref:hypothetical protein n=1 Tax=Streptomyces sp. NPDC102364 TaxID=3366161 RepID=UPI0038122E3B
MTALLPEQPAVVVFGSSTALESVIGTPRLIVPGVNAWLGETDDQQPRKSDFQQSLDDGFTETFEDFCTRISKEETS